MHIPFCLNENETIKVYLKYYPIRTTNRSLHTTYDYQTRYIFSQALFGFVWKKKLVEFQIGILGFVIMLNPGGNRGQFYEDVLGLKSCLMMVLRHIFVPSMFT
jgi:hypothetical protein